MAHIGSRWGKGGQQRRQYFFFHFVRMPSSWKKVPLKCLLPPPSSLCNTTNMSRKPAILTKYFPDWFLLHWPPCIVIHWVCTVSMSGLCYWLGFYELLMAARLHPLTWRIWLLLFVSTHSHCTACNRGQSDRGHHFASRADLNALRTWEKSPRGVVGIGKDWTIFCRR